MKRVFALLTVTVLTGAHISSAAPVDFFPKFAWFGGDYELEAGYISVAKERDGELTKSEVRGIEHKINLETLGYVYHPSLLYFEGAVSLNLDDEGRRSTDASGAGEWRGYKTSQEEYNLDGIILGRKPLNLDFHLSEERPFLTSSYVDSSRTIGLFRSKVSLNYKKKPLISSLSYSHDTSEAIADSLGGGGQNSKSRNDGVDARFSYGTDNYSVSTFGRHSEILENNARTTVGLVSEKSTQDQFGISSKVIYKRYVFANTVELSRWDKRSQEKFVGVFREDIDIALPWNMDSEINLDYDQRDENNYNNLGEFTDNKSNKDEKIFAVLHHQLFDSVFSTLSGDYQKNNSTTSSRVSQHYLLGVQYKKKLRRGSLNGSVENELYITEQQGTPFIDGERQGETIKFVGDSFVVDLPRAVENTIVVEVFNTRCSVAVCNDFGADPVTGLVGAWQVVSRDQWQVVDSGAQFLEIMFKRDGATEHVDPALDQSAFSPSLQVGPYTNLVRVSYSQPDSDFKVQSNISSLSVNISLFEKLFYGYFDHLLTSQEYIDGDQAFGELAPTVTEDEIGVALAKQPFGGSATYRIVTSDLLSEWRWKVSGNYGQSANLLYKIKMNWGADYFFEKLLEEDSLGVVLGSSEEEFNARTAFSSLIPYTPILASFTSTYIRHRGVVTQHNISRYGIWETISSTVDDKDKDTYRHRLNLGMMLPFVNMKINLYGTYEVEHFILPDDWVVTRDLGINTGRVKYWRFGGTSVVLDGSYNYDISEVARVTSTKVESNSRTAEGWFEINLKIKRSFY